MTRAIALLPRYAGTHIAEIAALEVADVRLSARKGEIHLVGKGEKPGPHFSTRRCARRCPCARRRAPPSPAPGRPSCFSPAGHQDDTDAITDVISAITTAAGRDDHIAELMGHASRDYEAEDPP